MKRDMDIVRRMAFATEALQPGQKLRELDGIDTALFCEHVLWMQQANLVQARIHTDQNDSIASASVVRLTWDGCEFLDSVRNETLWAKAKEIVLIPTASFTFGLLKEWLAQQISKNLPTLGG